MTAYNREKYIAEAIESVLTSSFTDFELLISDDGSTDGTLEIIKRFVEADRRVKLFTNPVNLGDYANRNAVAKRASGKYIKYLDSDDYFLEGGLEYCVKAIEDAPDAQWGIEFNLKKTIPKLLTSREAIRLHFFEQPFLLLGPGSCIIKRDFFYEVGMYPVKYGPANDLYFNLNAASRGSLVLLDKSFFYYRLHQGQERNNNYQYLINLYRHLEDALAKLDLGLTEKEKQFILRKGKRRFITNCIEYIFAGQAVHKIPSAIKAADFSIRDFLEGVFS